MTLLKRKLTGASPPTGNRAHSVPLKLGTRLPLPPQQQAVTDSAQAAGYVMHAPLVVRSKFRYRGIIQLGTCSLASRGI